jgi:hypothetical protein
MKKIMVLCLVIALAFGASGATCLQNVQTNACNPPAAVIAILPAAISIITTALSVFVPGTAPYLAAVNSSAVANSIEVGICVSALQLNALIAFLQSQETKTVQTKMMMKAGPARAKALDISPLVAWSKTAK